MSRSTLKILFGIHIIGFPLNNISAVHNEININSLRSQKQIKTNASESYHDARGTNLFFHEITSGTCASNGMNEIMSSDACILAADKYGYNFQTTKFISNNTNEKKNQNNYLPYGCFVQPWIQLPFELPAIMHSLNDILTINKKNSFNSDDSKCHCTQSKPCFCSTYFYIDRRDFKPRRKAARADGQFIVTWNLELGGREDLLESPFLRAAFAQSVKDYINNDIRCSDDINVKGAEFLGVVIPFEEDTFRNGENRRAVSGNGKCKGDVLKCRKGLRLGRSKAAQSPIVPSIHKKDDSCDKTIFDSFSDKIISAASYDYRVDVEAISDLRGNMDLTYNVKFEESPGKGLDQVDRMGADPSEPESIDPVCIESHCETQRDTMLKIFRYFNSPLDESRHECLHEGINCNDQDLVTHIWIVNKPDLMGGKTIPEDIAKLQSLEGIFLGSNKLKGTIPNKFGSLRKLKMLWFERNQLSGTLPFQLGNIRRLEQINLNDNMLTGSIPNLFRKLENLEMLNLGKNPLTGIVPMLTYPAIVEDNDDCVTFADPFSKVLKKFGRKWLNRGQDESLGPVDTLTSLSLCGTKLTGTIPPEVFHMYRLEELCLADNLFTGTISEDLTNLRNLKTFNAHNNFLTGAIPKAFGNLFQVEKINLANNSLSQSIPTVIGNLRALTSFNLDNNTLTGSLPTEIGLLTKLTTFTFSGNNMTGEIVSELGNLEQLINLDLRGYKVGSDSSRRKLVTTLPSELGRLTNWKNVVFEDNLIEGPLPSEFGNLLSAEVLWMSDQNISGEFPPELANLKNVNAISFANNNLEGEVPSFANGYGMLRMIHLGGNKLSGQLQSSLSNLTQLTFMNIGKNNLNGTLPSDLASLSSLKYLGLEENNLSGALPTEFGSFSELEGLNLRSNSLSGAPLDDLVKVQTLQLLMIDDNELTGTFPTEIGDLQNLATLDLSSNRLVGTIPTELGKLPVLDELQLDDNFNVTGTIPTEIGLLDVLTILSLGNLSLTGTLPEEMQNLDSLISVNLAGLNVTGKAYFACNIESMALSDNMDSECYNYCGTEDEECSGLDIGTATCLDVDCNGLGGTPTCTPTCMLDYTSCNASPDQLTVELEMQTDSAGEEITWEVRNNAGEIVFDNTDGYKDNLDVLEFFCIGKDRYEFELKDSSADGLCGGLIDGSYILSVDDKKVANTNPCFGSSIIHEIGIYNGPSTSPSFTEALPSVTPSSASSATPSSASSVKPSITPSFISSAPSMTPSYSSSPTSSKTPSSYPSLSSVPTRPRITGMPYNFDCSCGN